MWFSRSVEVVRRPAGVPRIGQCVSQEPASGSLDTASDIAPRRHHEQSLPRSEPAPRRVAMPWGFKSVLWGFKSASQADFVSYRGCDRELRPTQVHISSGQPIEGAAQESQAHYRSISALEHIEQYGGMGSIPPCSGTPPSESASRSDSNPRLAASVANRNIPTDLGHAGAEPRPVTAGTGTGTGPTARAKATVYPLL